MRKKTVSLVLSSGGARGMAHIGAIEALEARGYEIVSIAGSSAGALIGGMHAAGKMSVFKDWICNLDRVDVFSLMDFTFSSKGFIKGIKVFNALKKLIADCDIEELPIPFVCTAVEIPSGKEQMFRSGSLYAAIRASVSIPTVLMPARVQGKEYIDGGILNPIPFNLLNEYPQGDLIVAVDLNGPKEIFVDSPVLADKKENSLLKFPPWLMDYRAKFSTYFSSDQKEQVKYKGMSSLDLLNYSFDMLQDKLSALVIEKQHVDILVEISRTQAGTLEFHRASEMIAIGKNKMEQALDAFENGNR
jgi:NTE family protein